MQRTHVLRSSLSLPDLGGDPAVESLGLHGHAVGLGGGAEVVRAAVAVDVGVPVGEGLLHAHRTVEPLEVSRPLDGPRAQPVVIGRQGRRVLPG